MWGGIKHRKDYGQLFRDWSAAKGVEVLRKNLLAEPRPWWIGWSLHQFRHSLDDKNAASILRWCGSVVRLESNYERRVAAYGYTQDLFTALESQHRLGSAAFAQYLSLCESAGDLSSAFKWIRFYVDKHQEHRLHHYVFLLRIAVKCPKDDLVDEAVAAVKEVYEVIFCETPSNDGKGFVHMDAQTVEEQILVEELFVLLARLRHRLDDDDLLQWIDRGVAALRESSQQTISNLVAFETDSNATQVCKSLSPTLEARENHVRQALNLCCPASVFPQLDFLIRRHPKLPSISHPHLIDSLLSDVFLRSLEEAAFGGDVKRVTTLIQAFLEDIKHLKTKVDEKAPPTRLSHHATATNPIPVWRDYRDPVHQAFRAPIIESQGVTTELYHYLIVALSSTSVRLALSTAEKMTQRGMRTLDLTRAVLVDASRESINHQVSLLKEQLEAVEFRKKLDSDYESTKAVEAYWKYDYALLLYYRNALSMAAFYEILMDKMGVRAVVNLIVAANAPHMTIDDVVLVDEDARAAAAAVLRRKCCDSAAQVRFVIDEELLTSCKGLDVALVNDIPSFGDYMLQATDDVATSGPELRNRIEQQFGQKPGRRNIFILDASFIEANEAFSDITSRYASDEPSLFIIPYTSLAQIADTAEDHVVPCLDEEVKKVRSSERNASRQKLRHISSLIRNAQQSAGPAALPMMILHFTECLLSHMLPLAHSVPATSAGNAKLVPHLNDDDQLIVIAAYVQMLMEREASVVLCTEDPLLVDRIKRDPAVARFLGNVQLVHSKEPTAPFATEEQPLPDEAVEFVVSVAKSVTPTAVTDNSIVRDAVKAAVSSPAPSTSLTPPDSQKDVEFSASSWLSMLEDDDSSNNGLKPSLASSSTAVPQSITPQATAVDNAVSETEFMFASPTSLTSLADEQRAIAEDLSRDMFEHFHVVSPDEEMEREMRMKASAGHDVEGDKKAKFKRGVGGTLVKEAALNRGFSMQKRRQLASHLSNRTGARVPFNFRYKVYEANIHDPRNRHLLHAYQEGIEKKRRRPM